MGCMRKALILALAALAIPAAASAATGKQYLLPHPKRERCKANYVKKVERGETWCVRLTPTTIGVSATSEFSGGPTGTYVTVSADIWTGTHGHEGKELVGLPVRVTITDATTGAFAGSFPGVSNTFAFCTLVTSFNEQLTVKTFTGEAVTPHPACALAAPVSMPAADLDRFGVSFAGNSTYAPSSFQELA